MSISHNKQNLLKKLPGVDILLHAAQQDVALNQAPKRILTDSIRTVLEVVRTTILHGDSAIDEASLDHEHLLMQVKQQVQTKMALRLTRTINATGVVVHTNLGRSMLPEEAIEHVLTVAGHYSNLEFDLNQGKRGSRYSHVEEILCEISGAEAAVVVNNNAAAVLICLETMARGKEVIVSRGELVEIGGSFRIPDVMVKSGAVLKEVGTTNRTHAKDYAGAIGQQTAMLLKVHTSNYAIIGFTKSVTLKALVDLGHAENLIVMEDLGSGTLVDFSPYGLPKEPTVQDAVKIGADVITFSGDKLLGGPQAGIILGKKNIIEHVRRNPLNRALRIDKMTLAALESTLRLYRDERCAIQAIPTLRMLTLNIQALEGRADQFCQLLQTLGSKRLSYNRLNSHSRAGGGALPQLALPTICIGIKITHTSVNTLENEMRSHVPPIIGRIEDDLFIVDMRTVQDDELFIIVNAIKDLLEKEPND